MNKFEKEVQCQRNDAIDSGIGFAYSFGFFFLLFIIATVIKVMNG